MVFKISPLILFVLLINPLSVFSQNNSPEVDYESLAKKKAHHRNPGFINPWLSENQPGGLWHFLRWKFGSNPYADEKKNTSPVSQYSDQCQGNSKPSGFHHLPGPRHPLDPADGPEYYYRPGFRGYCILYQAARPLSDSFGGTPPASRWSLSRTATMIT